MNQLQMTVLHLKSVRQLLLSANDPAQSALKWIGAHNDQRSCEYAGFVPDVQSVLDRLDSLDCELDAIITKLENRDGTGR